VQRITGENAQKCGGLVRTVVHWHSGSVRGASGARSAGQAYCPATSINCPYGGGFTIIDPFHNNILHGERFDLSAEDVIEICTPDTED
jgi:hypothetical protein